MMLALAGEVLTEPDVTLRQASYLDLPSVLQELGWTGVDRILVDLGLSSDQLADVSSGFSFHSGTELDMRFDRTQGLSAADLLATVSVEELERIFREFGEEPLSRPIADYVITQRTIQPIRTGVELANAVKACLPGWLRDGHSHPATRVFQALRIAVNDELGHVRRAVDDVFPASLNPGGILGVISFHSLEDRIVKQALKNSPEWDVLTPKPIAPRPAEVRFNPRSRSAKLRLARKISK
jgi:16S rRNA (cytosine1402-N4)-methyltransferase